MKLPVTIRVNGRTYEREIEPRLLLVHFLRDVAGLTGTKIGCDTSQCGACTVLLDGATVKSCTCLAAQADGCTVTTIEGLAKDGQLSTIQEAFWSTHGLQCGYCTPRMVFAAHAIVSYTQPGDLVFDPMAGIGTTLVEAVYAGRDALGVEYESRWADIADANLARAHDRGVTGHGAVIRGDATRLAALLPTVLHGRVALVVTSPPYGPTVHGLVRPGADGVAKSDNRYSDTGDRGNLAYRDLPGLVDGFTDILRGCHTLLRPSGVVVVTARPWRKHGELVDLPSAVVAAGTAAGLTPIERCIALLAAVRDGRLLARPSFFQLQQVRKARNLGVPMHLIAHEDVIVLAKDPQPGSDRIRDSGR